MKSIIMAGGFGTRLRPLTFNIPKPMIPLLNRPMMKHITDLLKQHGIHDMISLLYYLPETISGYFGDGSRFGINMKYVMSESDLGTAGSVRNAAEHIDETILIISADVLTNFDLSDAIRFHKERKAKATILLTRVENPLQFGIVIADEQGKIQRFLEKPAWGQVFSDTVNTGIYILEPEVMNWIPKGQEFDFSKNLFPALLKAGEPLYGYIAKGYWRDIGNLREYRKANADVLRGEVELSIPGKREMSDEYSDAEVWMEEGAIVEPGAKLKGRVLVGAGAKIEAGAFVENSVIGPDTTVGTGSRILETVFWDGTTVGAACQITDAIIGSKCEIGSDSSILEHAVLADNVTLEPGVMIAAGVKIWPDKVVGRRAHVTESFIWGDRLTGQLFTNARVSGTVNKDISPEFASRLGAALGARTGRGSTVAVSRDVDRASQIVERSFFCGLLASGVNVDEMGVLPIPVMRFELARKNRHAGVHIRRNPNDREGVDIIFFQGDGTDLPTPKARAVEEVFYRGDFPRATYDELGILNRPMQIWESYQAKLLSSIDTELIKSKKMRVVVDFRWGGSVPVLMPALQKAGCRVYPVNAYVDTTRFTRTREELKVSLQETAQVVNVLGADIGFMIDPSGERLYMVDNKNNVFDSHEELYLLTKLFLETQKAKAVAFPIGATMAVSLLAREKGVREIRTESTHLAMMQAALTDGVDFVAGTRGGFIFPEFGFASDAMFALIKTLEMLAKLDTNLSELGAQIPRYTRINKDVECPWHKKGQVMRNLIESTKDLPRDVVDGVRVITADAWCLITPDPEEPLFTLYVEAQTPVRAEELMEQYSNLVRTWQE